MSRVLPILFNTDMVRAILDGKKTMTRRAIQKIPYGTYRIDPSDDGMFEVWYGRITGNMFFDFYDEVKPPYRPGDVLYVRETWCKGKIEFGEEPDGREAPYISQCTGENDIIPKEYAIRNDIGIEDVVWKPSIYMPKEVARIWLKVTDVRAERLCDISTEDAISEGCAGLFVGDGSHVGDGWKVTPEEEFAKVWDSTIPKHPGKSKNCPHYWKDNPWVWAIKFERCEKPKKEER